MCVSRFKSIIGSNIASFTIIFRMPDNLKVSNKSTPIHYSQVGCTGEQDSLLDCQLSEITTECTHDHDAAIVCRHSEEGMVYDMNFFIYIYTCILVRI